MRKLTLFLFVLAVTPAFSADMAKVRDLFAKISIDQTSCKSLISLTKSYSLSNEPLLYAYYAAAEMALANHTSWPSAKLAHFNSGKSKLEAAIKKYPNDAEMRYIRYCVQQGCPFFLGYSSDKQADKKFVLDHIDQTDWTAAYRKKVREHLNA